MDGLLGVLQLAFLFWCCLTLLSSSLHAQKSHEGIFTHIYDEGVWGKNEEGIGYSGTGSDVKQAYPYIKFLQDFIKANEIHSVVDAGCGDWTLSKHISWGDIQYTGIDVVKTVIERNQKNFSSPNVTFIHENISSYDFPKADLLICKDVLQHLSNDDIASFLEKTSKFKHCLITNDVDPSTLTSVNQDITSGDWHVLDLTKPPFSVDGIKVFTYRSGNVVKQILYIQNKPKDKTVLISILARNKGHLLPKFLKCIEALDYDKKQIGIYINTNNNSDNTLDILMDWIKENQKNYRFISFDTQEARMLVPGNPHAWTSERFSYLGEIRNKSLRKVKEHGLDYYFVVDCDNFINPCTLKELIKKDKPIIAPMLVAVPENNDAYSNFFAEIDQNGYFATHPDYFKFLFRFDIGTFQVPVVHCTYLIKSEYIDQLTYQDGTKDYEFIIFSRSARENGIDQYICNEKDFGYLFHFYKDLTHEEEKDRVAKFYSR